MAIISSTRVWPAGLLCLIVLPERLPEISGIRSGNSTSSNRIQDLKRCDLEHFMPLYLSPSPRILELPVLLIRIFVRSLRLLAIDMVPPLPDASPLPLNLKMSPLKLVSFRYTPAGIEALFIVGSFAS